MDGRLVRVSKSLSWLLRHGAGEAGVSMDREGYVPVSEVLGLKQFKDVSLGDLLCVVENNSKKRFEVAGEGAALRVRASQGHSRQVADRIDHAALLTPITPDRVPSACVHGTYMHAWAAIQREGLKRMGRQHIHCTDSLTRQEGQAEISGFRASCDVMIHIDVARAMAAGVEFFRSANGVILTEGHEGVLPPAFFANVTDRHGRELQWARPETRDADPRGAGASLPRRRCVL